MEDNNFLLNAGAFCLTMMGLTAMALSFQDERDGIQRRVRRGFWATTNSLTEMEFRRAFRLHRRDFAELVERVRPEITRDERMEALRNGAIEAEVRVAVVLRILSGAEYLDMMILWGFSRESVFAIFSDTMDAIIRQLPFPSFPDTEDKCAELAAGFRSSCRPENPLLGCVGALDGIAIKIRKPRSSVCSDPANYYHRKGFYAIPVQAICDSNYRFLVYSAKCAGPTHDSVAFSVSSFAERLRAGHLPGGYGVAADDAYVCDETVITPVPMAHATHGTDGDNFNFYHSSMRMHIEQAFGILVARWGILWRPLQFSLERNVRIIHLAMVLHNYCIERDDLSAADTLTEAEHAEVLAYMRALITTNHGRAGARTGTRASKSAIRDKLVHDVASIGLTRPSIARALQG